MTTPEVVVFDLGKVLLDFDYMIAARKLSARSEASPEAINQLINQSPLLVRYEHGQMTTAEFFDEVRSVTKFQGGLDEFAPIFGDIFFPIEPMIQLHAALREKSVPNFIFSNTNELAVTHIQRTFPFFNRFDGYIYSYQHGVMKPDPKIYEVVERVSKHRGEQILYIDDRAENVAGGAARSWQTILQQAPEDTVAAIKKLGLI